MGFAVEAACGCDTGMVRKNNEDNFCFDGKFLEAENDGLREPVTAERPVKNGFYAAVFDGMGGENFGERASYAAARQMGRKKRTLAEFFLPEEKYLNDLAMELNDAVLKAQRELCTERMGSTMVSLCFSGRWVYTCNLGDSRAYRLRAGQLLRLSVDHVEERPGRGTKKAPLTRYLGIDPEEMRIEPHIARGEVKRDDVYLLCSDGLTDMLTDPEISGIMAKANDAKACVQELIQAALAHGGRDNITAVVCRIK